MRETLLIEVRLHRFDVWRSAVAAVALAAIASLATWSWSTASSRGSEGVAGVFAIAIVLALATLAAATSLVRVPGGVLACRDGGWSFEPDAGAAVAGPMTVALDWGAFLLLRIGSRAGRVWLPVQRRGLERDWHALRCALYSSPPIEAAPAAAASPRE